MRTLAIALVLFGISCSSHYHGPAMMKQQPDGGVAKYARFRAGNEVHYGVLEGERLRVISGVPWEPHTKSNQLYPVADVKLLPPVESKKVLALAGNYASHMAGKPLFKNPELFFKLPTCLVGQGDDVVIPKGTEDVHYEAELVLVIGKRAKNVTPEQAPAHLAGVTCGNDISARDWQKGDVQWWRAKGCDTFGPIGPYLVTGLNPDNLLLRMRVNGEEKQKENTKDLLFKSAEIISFVSRHVTLEPGDTIFTGTPQKTTPVKPGDVMEVEIDGIGILRNKVAAAP
jgi:2-keto-4-pentenoate hydratase/2-oxohepta-3-ene-1,7-dioic acid hydratase in catechol pathway